MKMDLEEEHLMALMISPLTTVLNVEKGWHEEKCRKF